MTRRLSDEEWIKLWDQFPGPCLDWIRPKLDRDGFFETTTEEMQSAAGCLEPEPLIQKLLQLGALDISVRKRCGCCADSINDSEAEDEVCPHCGRAFVDCEGGVIEENVYSASSATGRFVPWVLVLHGMNTRGPWQEELNWLISTTYGRSVPVFIYKYGKVRPGSFFRFRQRQFVKGLVARIVALAGEQKSSRYGPKPDVIAHSLGTLLLGKALEAFPELKVGRVVLAGSILRPDFNWQQIRQRGQVDAVLNHWGGRDIWTRCAHLAIPDSGPSGAGGFNHVDAIFNRVEDDFSHSSFFLSSELPSVFAKVWQPFMTRPKDRLREIANSSRPTQWKPSFWRAPKFSLVILLFATSACLLICA